jgi:hypothetical protein
MIPAVLCLAVLAAQDTQPPEFAKFEMARERVGHKVVVDAALRNPGAAELADLKVTVLFFEGDREMRRSKTIPVPKVPARGTAAFKIEAEQVPNFTRFDLYLESAASTRLYSGTEQAPLPQIKGPGRASVSVVASRLGPPITVVVKNTGGTAADEPTAALTFRDASGRAIRQLRVRLEKNLPPLSEETFEVAVPDASGAATVDATVAWQGSDEFSLPETVGGARDLTIQQCRAVRLTDGTARVSGVFANGSPTGVEKISVRFRLGTFDAPYEAPGGLKAGESRPFVFYVPACPAFDALSFELSFEGAKAPGAPPAPPSSRRASTRRVEGEALKLPPPPPKAAEDVARPPGAPKPPSVGIRGLLVSEGSYGKGGKYSGDVYLMRMTFTDGAGKPFQPDATVSFTLYDGDRQVRKAQRSVTREGWGTDAVRVNGRELEMDTIAYDRKAQELWVAIHWTDAAFKKPRADIVVEIPNVGTYTFPGVDRDWAAAPRWPDVK